MTFQAWVDRLIDERFETATALAAALEMQLSPFTRGVKAGTLNLVNLLKLAKVAEVPPATVLRLAGKGDEAQLLEDLYGTGEESLTGRRRELLKFWDHIDDPKTKDFMFDSMRRFAALSEHGGSGDAPFEKGAAASRSTSDETPATGRRPSRSRRAKGTALK